jgi:hypothetical protein
MFGAGVCAKARGLAANPANTTSATASARHVREASRRGATPLDWAAGMSRRLSNNRAPANATAAWLAVAAVLAGPGCSFLFSEGAPENHAARESFSCGESYVPPVLDTVASALLAFEAVATAESKSATIAMKALDDRSSERHALNVDIAVQTAFATIAAAGAIYGYHAVADCREARDVRLALVNRARALPPPYGVPPMGEPPPMWPPRPPAPYPPAQPAPSDVAPLPATPSP